MGRPRLPRLGLRKRAALLQARGGQRKRRRRLPRHGPARSRSPTAARGTRCRRPISSPASISASSAWPISTRRLKRVSATCPSPSAGGGGGARPAAISPGDGAEERAGADTCARAACTVRGQACHTRRVCPPGPYRAGGGGWRGDSLRRRLRVAAAPHALRRRPGRPCERIRRAGGPRPAGRRREPSGSSGPRPDLLGKRDDLQHANRPRPRAGIGRAVAAHRGPGRGPHPIPR